MNKSPFSIVVQAFRMTGGRDLADLPNNQRILNVVVVVVFGVLGMTKFYDAWYVDQGLLGLTLDVTLGFVTTLFSVVGIVGWVRFLIKS